MQSLRDIPISRKLAVIVTAATTAALLLMSAAFTAYDYFTSRGDALEHLGAVCRMVASNSAAAVAFNDPRAAAEVLRTLQGEPEIQLGCTYDSPAHLLAGYARQPGQQCPPAIPIATGAALIPAGAAYAEPVRLNDNTTGYVYIESDLAQMRVRRNRFAAITVAFLFVSLLAGVLLGTVLQRVVVTPITALAGVMERVSQSRDYTLRAPSGGADEIGKLVSGFNQMLVEIQDSHGRLKEQALNDELTGLPNRRLLADRLPQALAAAQRQQNAVAVIYMDLDGFKLVNDTLGHSAGDLLLRQVAQRLRQRIRASDTFARIGGDEFTVIATQLRNAREAALIAQDLLAQFAAPFCIQEQELILTASMGISLYPQDALQAEQMIQQADTAMYVAKNSGKNRVTFFTPEFGDAVRERLELENQLRGALERGELAVHYQPEFEAATDRLVRFEALLRWYHPTLGMIPPAKFIPIAEESGLILPIGRWVMEQACAAAVRWQTESANPPVVAVNVSTIQFLQNNFLDMVRRILQQTGLPPRLLQLEMTESVLMPGHGDALAKLAEVRALGVSLAVDDFGTGYSSLSYLPRLPFDYLKIDRSFLEHILDSQDPRAMMESVVNLAHNLHITVIVEGVETPEQLALIRNMGCDEVQGYLLGRPTADPDQYLGKRPLARAQLA